MSRSKLSATSSKSRLNQEEDFEQELIEDFPKMLSTSITAIDKMLGHWQKKIKMDQAAKVENAFPQLLKYIIIELQEHSFTIKKVLKVIDPKAKVQFKKEVLEGKQIKGIKASTREEQQK
mgnify:CR=1 FL=1